MVVTVNPPAVPTSLRLDAPHATHPPGTPASSEAPVDTEVSNESTAPSDVVIDTTPATTIAGSGLTPA